jgi:hypothetical protein
MKNLNIPYEIVLVYFDHGTDLFPEVVNKKDLTKPLRNKVYNSVKSANFNLNGNKTVEEKDISEVVVLNSGFHISLAENSLFSSYERYNVKYGEGGSRVAVRIQNDELDSKLPGRNVYIYVTIEGFFKILQDTRYVSDGNLHGTFSLGIGCFPSLKLVKEDSTNKSFTCSTEIGKLIATKPKTTKWKPGYVYALSPMELVLYLGSYIEPFSLKLFSYSGGREKVSSIFLNFFDSYRLDIESDREIHLCIPINKRNNILEKLSGKNNNIKDFIQGYFSENVDNIRDGITREVLDIKKTAMKGTEIEQLLVGVDDTYNPRDVIVGVIESLSHVDSIDFSALSSKPLVDLNVTDGYYLSILEIDLKFFLGNYPKLKKFYIEKLLEKDNVEYKRILQYKSLYSDTSLDSILNLTQYYKGVFILKNLSNYFGLTEDDIKQLVIDKVMKN